MYKLHFLKSGKTVLSSGQETVLEAAQAAGIDIPYSCQGGTCHTCAVMGEGDMDTEEMLALNPQELAQGWRLTCVAKATGDCTFDV